jgi:DNA processing protein
MTAERAAWVAVALTPGIGASRMRYLLAACHTAYGALTAPFSLLCAIPGLSGAVATALKQRSLADGEAAIAEAERLGAQVLVPGDAGFPAALREIRDAPTVLFALGKLELLERPAVAIVGSRDHTRYGAEVARMLASGAAAAGVAVVSGMARGLDALAHESALAAGGGTIGVLGNGIGVIYPAANRSLYQRVTAEGLLLSEFPPGERPNAGSFPRRNRLISGLSRVTVVVEAAHGSGALITASSALEQGRDVMAVPGPITSARSAGTNTLIRDGAEPLLELGDLLAHYPEATLPPPDDAPGQPRLPAGLRPDLRALALALGADPVHADALSAATRRPIAEVLGALCELELLGVVEQRPGQWFPLAGAG